MADKWRTAWNPSVAKFQTDMKAGQKYHLRLEWVPDGGVSYTAPPERFISTIIPWCEAPYERMPVFVREGAILPAGPEIEHTGEKRDAPIDLYVYTGADGSFDLYEDEETNYNYEKGAFSLIRFHRSEADKTLTIGNRQGTFDRMAKDRFFRIIFVSGDHPVPFLSPDATVKEIHYNGHQQLTGP